MEPVRTCVGCQDHPRPSDVANRQEHGESSNPSLGPQRGPGSGGAGAGNRDARMGLAAVGASAAGGAGSGVGGAGIDARRSGLGGRHPRVAASGPERGSSGGYGAGFGEDGGGRRGSSMGRVRAILVGPEGDVEDATLPGEALERWLESGRTHAADSLAGIVRTAAGRRVPQAFGASNGWRPSVPRRAVT